MADGRKGRGGAGLAYGQPPTDDLLHFRQRLGLGLWLGIKDGLHQHLA